MNIKIMNIPKDWTVADIATKILHEFEGAGKNEPAGKERDTKSPMHEQAAEVLEHIRNRDYGLAESKAELLQNQLWDGTLTLGPPPTSSREGDESDVSEKEQYQEPPMHEWAAEVIERIRKHYADMAESGTAEDNNNDIWTFGPASSSREEAEPDAFEHELEEHISHLGDASYGTPVAAVQNYLKGRRRGCTYALAIYRDCRKRGVI